jgi:ankyrin repeat protein
VDVLDLLLSRGVASTVTDERQDTLLLLAARQNRRKTLAYLLEKKIFDVNAHASGTTTALALGALWGGNFNLSGRSAHLCPPAAAYNSIDCAKLLLEHGANVNLPAETKASPINYALKFSEPVLLQMLLERGAKMDDKEAALENAAHYLAFDNVLWLIKDYGAKCTDDVEMCGEKRAFSSLTHSSSINRAAAGSGCITMLKLIMRHRENPDAPPSNRVPPAAVMGSVALLRWLKRRFGLVLTREQFPLALHIAAAKNKAAMCRYLVEEIGYPLDEVKENDT